MMRGEEEDAPLSEVCTCRRYERCPFAQRDFGTSRYKGSCFAMYITYPYKGKAQKPFSSNRQPKFHVTDF